MPKILYCIHCGLMGELFHIISENECVCMNCHKINKFTDMIEKDNKRQLEIARMESEDNGKR